MSEVDSGTAKTDKKDEFLDQLPEYAKILKSWFSDSEDLKKEEKGNGQNDIEKRKI